MSSFDPAVPPPPAVLAGSPLRQSVKGATKTLSEYKKSLEPLIIGLFSSGDIQDFLRSVEELKNTAYLYELVKRAISMSFDRGDRERELISQAISTAYPKLLSTSVIGKGFERLFELIDEYEKDSPFARGMLSIFLARAVVDEVLPPSFLTDPVVCNLGGILIVHARAMLIQDHKSAKMEHIWGPGDGQRPVEELKVTIDQLCQEYLLSGDLAEAARCVKELNIAHYHHEVVVRAIKASLDGSEASHAAMSSFLKYLVCSEEVVSKVQCALGFQRMKGVTKDWCLDTPNAPTITRGFADRAIADGIIAQY